MLYGKSTPLPVRGFNLCESILRHTPDELRTFIRRMKTLRMNTLIVHYDYGWNRYKELIMEECRKAGVEITLMTFGPRTFFRYTDWKPEWFAKKEDGSPWTKALECETHPCCFVPEALEAFEYGAKEWLKSLPPEIHHVHMRAGDGQMFCMCEKCRNLPEYDRWQPFVDRFAKAVHETRPALEYESDIYYKRYRIPSQPAAFQGMTRIMFDTFYRHPAFSLTCFNDSITASRLQYADSSGIQILEKTASEFYFRRLKEWCAEFPNRIYLHENAMMQCYMGAFQYGTSTYLKDIAWFREAGIQGVCYEAYEPGYAQFDSMFEILAKALNGEDVEYEPDPLEKVAAESGMLRFGDNLNFPLEKYIKDPFTLQHVKYCGRVFRKPDAELLRDFVSFARTHRNRLDPILIAWYIAQFGTWQKKIVFRDLSHKAEDFFKRRKLWDFMEDIPLSEDPLEVCNKVIDELIDKGETVYE